MWKFLGSRRPRRENRRVQVAAKCEKEGKNLAARLERRIFAPMNALAAFPVRVWRFYADGFRQMTWGRTLWIIILLKLAVMFLVLRVFFFKPALAGMDTGQKQETVARNLSP